MAVKNPSIDVNNDYKFISDLNLYPNPVFDFLNIQTEFLNKIEIYSYLGIKVIETSYNEKIDVSDLPTGVYFIKIGDIIKKFNKL